MDGVAFVKGVVLGTVGSVAALVYLYRFEDYSRSVFIIYAALLLLALVGSRASFRLIAEFVTRRRTGQRLVIYGAGDGGAVAVRELLRNSREHYTMLGFVDDDTQKHKARVHGYPVLGGDDALSALIVKGSVDVVVLSAKELQPSRLSELERLCIEHGVALSRLNFNLESVVRLEF
jgi:UDP-GlcNAc:undecaprenyl-phosphate GlcNAc-1-phosphate transferase